MSCRRLAVLFAWFCYGCAVWEHSWYSLLWVAAALVVYLITLNLE